MNRNPSLVRFPLARAVALLAVLGGAAAPASAAAILEGAVERDPSGAVVVSWRTAQDGLPVDVFLMLPGEAPRLVSDDDRDGRHLLESGDGDLRPLVRLATASGESFVTAERVLPLEGGRNFRDLGGYRTVDGRRVKWGKVYRSGTMSGLTDADYQRLSSLGIEVICDFRAQEEREREPTNFRRIGPDLDYLTRDYRTDASALRAIFSEGRPTPDKVRGAMTSLYGEIPYQHADSYRTMFTQLAEGNVPLAFNCAAGKDRTGVAAALLLAMLGVPHESVVADYALSDKIVDFERSFARVTSPSAKPGPYDFLAKLPADVRAPLLRSDPAYVEYALAEIGRREGSLDNYFTRVLGLTEAQIGSIRSRLLE